MIFELKRLAICMHCQQSHGAVENLRGQVEQLRAALEALGMPDSEDGLCWCSDTIDKDMRTAFGHAGWCKRAKAALARPDAEGEPR